MSIKRGISKRARIIYVMIHTVHKNVNRKVIMFNQNKKGFDSKLRRFEVSVCVFLSVGLFKYQSVNNRETIRGKMVHHIV